MQVDLSVETDEKAARLLGTEGNTKASIREVTFHPNVIQNDIEGPKKGWRLYGGIIFGAMASLCFSVATLIIKLLGSYHPITIGVWRFFGTLVPATFIALYFQCRKDSAHIFQTTWPLNNKERVSNFVISQIRGVVTFGMSLMRFYSLQYLTIADKTLISYTGPVFVMILAYFVLGEKCGVIPFMVALVTCFGVFVIVRPPLFTGKQSFDEDNLIGVAFGLASMMCSALVVILVRKIRKVHFSYTMLIGSIWGFSESMIAAVAFNVLEFPKGTRDLILAFGLLPVVLCCGQFSMIMALKFEGAGPVSLIRAFEVLFAFTWQLVFLGVLPDVFSIVGAGIILFGVTVLTVRKWLSTLPQSDARRSRFGLLLK